MVGERGRGDAVRRLAGRPRERPVAGDLPSQTAQQPPRMGVGDVSVDLSERAELVEVATELLPGP